MSSEFERSQASFSSQSNKRPICFFFSSSFFSQRLESFQCFRKKNRNVLIKVVGNICFLIFQRVCKKKKKKKKIKFTYILLSFFFPKCSNSRIKQWKLLLGCQRKLSRNRCAINLDETIAKQKMDLSL